MRGRGLLGVPPLPAFKSLGIPSAGMDDDAVAKGHGLAGGQGVGTVANDRRAEIAHRLVRDDVPRCRVVEVCRMVANGDAGGLIANDATGKKIPAQTSKMSTHLVTDPLRNEFFSYESDMC